MITPVTPKGSLDEPAVDRLVEFLIAGGVDGIFVLGTTGEGASVPHDVRHQLVRRTVRTAAGRVKVYAGIVEPPPGEIAEGNSFFEAGVDAVVVRPPISFPVQDLQRWFQSLLDVVQGPVILYNMPSTTKVSIPLEVVGHLMGHPRLAGIKDSENNARRHLELLERFGKNPAFSVFIGVGALMAQGLKLGADGVVPSVGNLIPKDCHDLCATAQVGDWTAFENHFARMNAVSSLYQKGRTLDESLSALKGAVHCRGLCSPNVLPPLRTLSAKELEAVRQEMSRLNLLNGAA